MSIKHIEEYRDPDISKKIVTSIKNISYKNIRLMEVCGTHTMSIFRSGIRTLLPDTISLLSGPGCPVCVTTQKEIDAFIELAKIDDVILTTFGDLLKVPGTRSSLQKERAEGRKIRIVYSTFDAIDIAINNPDKKIIFLGIGFETTAPTIAASILTAKDKNINNYFVFSAHKLVPPALTSLVSNNALNIDGFILPGHVSVIIGTKAYLKFFERYKIPCVVTGFEPVDILQAILSLVRQIEDGNPELENLYKRAVEFNGNEKAKKILYDVFETNDASWRGIGVIPESGLKIREEFSSFDAEKMFEFDLPEAIEPKGCSCGEILQGIKIPPECALYKKACTPVNPVGPCMVSTEGTCAAYYRYNS
jgi:hydrogenase expression/formation protein HypD